MRVLWLRFSASGLLICAALCAQTDDQYTPKQRIATVRGLGKRGADAIPTLAGYLNDPDRDIRVEAVKAIIRIGGEPSLTPLAKATHDADGEVDIRATDGLVNFYLPGYVTRRMTGPLTRGLRQAKAVFGTRNDQAIGPDVTVRPDVAQAIGGEISNSSNTDARTNAARAAGILRAAPAVPALTGSLRAHDSQLIFESLVALQKIKDPSAGPAVSPVTRDLDERIQITALQTVGLLHSPSSAPDVRDALKTAKNQKVKRAALSALASLGLPDDRPIFVQYSSDSDADLKVAALEGLGRVREPSDFPALQTAYNEPNADWEIHLAAAFALVNEGKLDTAEFSPLPYLIESLGNKSKSETASAYLTELARRDDVEAALLSEIKHTSRDQKLALCQVLGQSQTDKAVPALTDLTRDINPDVALAASQALKMIQARRSS